MIDIQRQMEDHARSYGLDFFNTIFEVVDHDQLSAVAAYGGFPTRYPHWRFGVGKEQPPQGDSFRLQKNFRVGIKNKPWYAEVFGRNGNPGIKILIGPTSL